MTTAAAGSLATVQETMRTMLGDCAAFRTMVGATGANIQAQALANVYHEALPPPSAGGEYTLDELATMRPFALLSTLAFEKTHDSTGDGFQYSESGTIWLRLEWDVPVDIADNDQEIGRRVDNDIGGIIDDLCDLAGKGPYLSMEHIELTEPWSRTRRQERASNGDAVVADFTIDWASGRPQ